MSDPLVWLPFDPADLGDAPSGLRYETVRPGEHLPDSVEEVAFYVTPYRFGLEPARARALSRGDLEAIRAMRSLEVAQLLSAGTEHAEPFVPEGVTLCNGRGIHDDSTAELALTLTLALLRGVPGMVERSRSGTWEPTWGQSLADRRVLVLGAGAIAEAIRVRAEAFGAEVVLVGRTARAGVRTLADVSDLLPGIDVVIAAVPLTDDTRGLVDAAFLGRLPDGAVVVNVARGPVVDTAALLAEVSTGRLYAGLDVTDPEPLPADHPLWREPTVLISPHVGGASSAMWPRARRLVRAQLERFAAGEPLDNVVRPGRRS